MPDVVLGIDPGLKGGLAVLTIGGDVASVLPMPTDADGLYLPGIVEFIRAMQGVHRVRLACVELIGARPGQGVCSMFTFGCGYGAVQGILTALDVPYELVRPQTWQKHILGGIVAADTKTASVAYCTKRFPGLSLKMTPRSRKAHDGVADAVAIGEYARRLAFGLKEAS